MFHFLAHPLCGIVDIHEIWEYVDYGLDKSKLHYGRLGLEIAHLLLPLVMTLWWKYVLCRVSSVWYSAAVSFAVTDSENNIDLIYNCKKLKPFKTSRKDDRACITPRKPQIPKRVILLSSTSPPNSQCADK